MLESEEEGQGGNEEPTINRRMLWLFVAGFAVIAIGVLVLVSATLLQGGSVSGGVVIFVGPLPIVFGVGPDALLLILISIVLTTLSIIIFVVLRRRIWV